MDKNSNSNTDIKGDKSYVNEEYLNTHSLFDNLIWMTTDEAANFLRKSSHALRQMTYKGIIRSRKFGGRLYFKKAELNELVDTSFYRRCIYGRD